MCDYLINSEYDALKFTLNLYLRRPEIFERFINWLEREI